MMMKKTIGILLGAACLLLWGCGPVYETSYTYQSPKSMQGKRCVSQCRQSRTMCKRLCTSETENCKLRARDDASYRYREYVARQRIAHRPIERTPDSFYSAAHCSRKSCSCEEDYRACFEMCGGEAIAVKRCVAFCN